MQKTIVVRITHLTRHPQYNRVTRTSNTFKAHDEASSAKVGDWVKIMETRPLSKDKRWRLVEILKRASSAPPVPGQEEQPKKVARKPLPAAQAPGQAGAVAHAASQEPQG
jgi:small subunit ribosomal protein S17